MGASLFVQHHRPHDVEQPWGADEIDALLAELKAALVPGARLGEMSLDLADAPAAGLLIDTASSALGHLDVLVCNHAVER